MGTYFIRTYGCQMNIADTRRMAELFEIYGLAPAKDIRRADFVLLNTCSVRSGPENKALGLLNQLRQWKQENPDSFLGVVGCMAQLRPGMADSFPFVDLVSGPRDFPDMVPRLEAELAARGFSKPRSCESIEPPRTKGDEYKAYVPVVRGCSNRCAYCVVPDARGPEVSRPLGEVVRECRELAERGCIEITLLGQNVLAWGRDSGEGDFLRLLEAVHEIDGPRRLAFLTSHPRDFSPDLPKKFAQLPKVCEYFHFPLQAGDDEVLKRMRRGYTVSRYLERVAAIRDAYSEPAVSSDFIVGFPGETVEAFEHTLELARTVRFDWAYMFKYSVRPNTPAADHPDDVAPEEKSRRHGALMELQDRICLENNQALVGRTVEIFVDEKGPLGSGTMLGRTRTNKKVSIPSNPELLGRIIPARITRAMTWSLGGEPL